MNRSEMLQRLRQPDPWDLLIIGGGATGVGCAVDAASRGFRTALVEQFDFGKGTSSRSTKLVHGGVRYLEKGDIPLVMEALKERGILRENAPHLVSDLAFIVVMIAFIAISRAWDRVGQRMDWHAAEHRRRKHHLRRRA